MILNSFNFNFWIRSTAIPRQHNPAKQKFPENDNFPLIYFAENDNPPLIYIPRKNIPQKQFPEYTTLRGIESISRYSVACLYPEFLSFLFNFTFRIIKTAAKFVSKKISK